MDDELDSVFGDTVLDIADETNLDSTGDSAILLTRPLDQNLLEITHDQTTVVIRFKRKLLGDEICLADYREQILGLVKHSRCKTFKFDFSGVLFVPSGMLGLLATAKQKGCEVEIHNPSNELLEVLLVTKLDRLFTICRS